MMMASKHEAPMQALIQGLTGGFEGRAVAALRRVGVDPDDHGALDELIVRHLCRVDTPPGDQTQREQGSDLRQRTAGVFDPACDSRP